MNPTYISDKQLAERFNVSRVTIWRWASQFDFPKPVKLSGNCTRWNLADVEAWEQKKINAA